MSLVGDCGDSRLERSAGPREPRVCTRSLVYVADVHVYSGALSCMCVVTVVPSLFSFFLLTYF